MKLLPLLVLSVSALMTSGCAGTLYQVFNRPVTSDHLDTDKGPNKLKTVSGDRRLVRAARVLGSNGEIKAYIICAETQADAISARSAKSDLSVKSGQALKEEYSELLSKTVERSEVSDVVRQLSWQICNAQMNGYLQNGSYEKMLGSIIDRAFTTLDEKGKTTTQSNTGKPGTGSQ
ncbi:hypothetical protein [Caulobacter hibisci]|uniref:Lipoprotein n=1 Tax=Caulobacter hibisci TaxID=2035993 RepID=A0ABS0SV34_9CAUL|nr:hypothetical protein [Caulobacter hibisci]MBI1682492.1 hypothetical protein [Caulobacter hibisci]